MKLVCFEDDSTLTSHHGSHDELPVLAEKFFDSYSIDGLIISSTASPHLDITPLFPAGIEVLVLDESTPLPILTSYPKDSLGKDRIADAVAALRYPAQDVLVIDMGTCVTYNQMRGREFLGGGISPGWHMRHKAMHHFTGRLPMVEPSQIIELPSNTESALQQGAFLGLLHELQGMIASFRSTHVEGDVILTGGDASAFQPHLENDIFADPFHTLKGLYDILAFQTSRS